MPRPATDPAFQRRAKTLEELARRQFEADFRTVLELAEGRRLLWAILVNEGGLFTSSAAPSGSETYFREGKREVALSLMRQAQEIAPELYVRMMDEQLREKADAAVKRKAEETVAASTNEGGSDGE